VKVGIIGGTGPAGRALAVRLAASGATVVLGSRDAHRAAEVAAELRSRWPGHDLAIEGATNEDAADGEITVLATVTDAAVPTALALAGRLAGRVMVSMANGMSRVGKEFQPTLPARGSIAATLQAALPEVKVTAAFHHLPAGRFAEIDRAIISDVLVCADDEGAGEATIGLVESIPGLRGVRAGSLASATAIEALTAVLVNVNMRYRAHTTLRIVGLGPDEDGA